MIKNILLLLLSQLMIFSCSTSNQTNEVNATIDLINVTNDKVKVVVKPAAFDASTITFQVPKIIPGTYALQDYGK